MTDRILHHHHWDYSHLINHCLVWGHVCPHQGQATQHIIKSVERIMSFTCLLSTTSGQERVWGDSKPTRPPPQQPSPFPTRSLRSVRKKAWKTSAFTQTVTHRYSPLLLTLPTMPICEANMFKLLFLYNFEWVFYSFYWKNVFFFISFRSLPKVLRMFHVSLVVCLFHHHHN